MHSLLCSFTSAGPVEVHRLTSLKSSIVKHWRESNINNKDGDMGTLLGVFLKLYLPLLSRLGSLASCFFFFPSAIALATQAGNFHLPNSKEAFSHFSFKCHRGRLTKDSGCSWPCVLRAWLPMMPKLASHVIIWEYFTLSLLNPGEIQLSVWTPNSCHKIYLLILLFLGNWWGVLRKYNRNKVCSQPRKPFYY